MFLGRLSKHSACQAINLRALVPSQQCLPAAVSVAASARQRWPNTFTCFGAGRAFAARPGSLDSSRNELRTSTAASTRTRARAAAATGEVAQVALAGTPPAGFASLGLSDELLAAVRKATFWSS